MGGRAWTSQVSRCKLTEPGRARGPRVAARRPVASLRPSSVAPPAGGRGRGGDRRATRVAARRDENALPIEHTRRRGCGMCVPGPPAIADTPGRRAFRPRAEPHRPRVAGGCALYDPGRVAPFLYRRRNRDVSGRKRMAPVAVLVQSTPRSREGQPHRATRARVTLQSISIRRPKRALRGPASVNRMYGPRA